MLWATAGGMLMVEAPRPSLTATVRIDRISSEASAQIPLSPERKTTGTP